MSTFVVTDTPVSDFWWRLLWVSNPEWAASGATPLPVYMAIIVAGHFPHMQHI